MADTSAGPTAAATTSASSTSTGITTATARITTATASVKNCAENIQNASAAAATGIATTAATWIATTAAPRPTATAPATAHVGISVELNRINKRVEFFRLAHRAFVRRMFAGRVDSISKQDDGFASFDSI